MRNLFTALAFISSVSLSIAGVSANQPYDFGVSIVELSDSTTTDDFENKKMELELDLIRKNKKARTSAGIESLVLSVGVMIFLNKGSNTNSLLESFEALQIASVVVLVGYVIIAVKYFITREKNRTDYKRSLKKLSNSLS